MFFLFLLFFILLRSLNMFYIVFDCIHPMQHCFSNFKQWMQILTTPKTKLRGHADLGTEQKWQGNRQQWNRWRLTSTSSASDGQKDRRNFKRNENNTSERPVLEVVLKEQPFLTRPDDATRTHIRISLFKAYQEVVFSFSAQIKKSTVAREREREREGGEYLLVFLSFSCSRLGLGCSFRMFQFFSWSPLPPWLTGLKNIKRTRITAFLFNQLRPLSREYCAQKRLQVSGMRNEKSFIGKKERIFTHLVFIVRVLCDRSQRRPVTRVFSPSPTAFVITVTLSHVRATVHLCHCHVMRGKPVNQAVQTLS